MFYTIYPVGAINPLPGSADLDVASYRSRRVAHDHHHPETGRVKRLGAGTVRGVRRTGLVRRCKLLDSERGRTRRMRWKRREPSSLSNTPTTGA